MFGCNDARRSVRGARRAVASLLAGVGLTACLLSTQSVIGAETKQATGTAAVRVYADADWYRSRPEREQRLRGILRERPVVMGPGSRSAVTFALETTEGTYPVYAAGVAIVFARFEGQRVEIEGKLVNLADEGFGRELWIATIRPLGTGLRSN